MENVGKKWYWPPNDEHGKLCKSQSDTEKHKQGHPKTNILPTAASAG